MNLYYNHIITILPSILKKDDSIVKKKIEKYFSIKPYSCIVIADIVRAKIKKIAVGDGRGLFLLKFTPNTKQERYIGLSRTKPLVSTCILRYSARL
jgi:hypothetical protein